MQPTQVYAIETFQMYAASALAAMYVLYFSLSPCDVVLVDPTTDFELVSD